MKVFVSAYACEPGLGSEIGVGWHWVLEMSRHFELWVLTRESNRHTIEPWIAEHPQYQGIHLIYFDLPKWARFWKKGLRGVRTYYNIWQALTDRIVRRTMRENGISTFHHLTYGNAMWRVSSYGQKQQFVWGPIGGLETIPEEYSRHYGRKERLTEAVRRQMVALTRRSWGFKRRCRNADVILCKTDITRMAIPEKYRHKAVLCTDVATDIESCQVTKSYAGEKAGIDLITVGRLDAWRGFDLCIEALAQAVRRGCDARLTIVGKGADMERLKGIAEATGMSDRVRFTGKVSMDEYRQLMAQADVVMNAALKEGAVTVAFDTMAMGKPLICIDTTGYTRYFSEDYAVLVPIGTRELTIIRLADGIVSLADASTRESMGAAAAQAARSFGWIAKGSEIAALFQHP